MRKKLILALIFLIILIGIKETRTTLYPMNVTIGGYYYILISDKLAEGISFTNSSGARENIMYPLVAGTFFNNATFNYNRTTKKTEYWVYVSSLNTEICHGAKYNLCSNLSCIGYNNFEILIGNVSWSASHYNDEENPSLLNSKRMVLGYDNMNKTRPNSEGYVYLRYWLDVPAGFPAYNYSTIYQIQLVPEGGTCV
ncbi:MAG: hypothetical protein NZ942_03170 [Candidatus Aenigmarchaeota archaeon]|nr:hypothetical protein [Candidatus Aenigmarchaeota archaeon]